ncbi:S1C family serine protease [Chryseosolibacter indicus]|uniref:Trypsin-like peptidase domain-containing protein n=1 Tax=Chryseosolibacter indicus TaxID=2782351 RepID=A0ABS5VSN9_9BACT|nr:trypsin-like peptidase domain-containing protein [Chryseosolibacter indicus]MBT1703889.1 trypsin-like peptidase domain-containing protein [Chryseosolibacter indicus]
MKNTLKIIVIGFLAGLGGSYTGYYYLIKPSIQQNQPGEQFRAVRYDSPSVYVPAASSATSSGASADPAVDFSAAAAKATQSVVYINSISEGVSYSYWDWFFERGSGRQTQVSSGSGVIFTSDGYIITNNHVVASAERIEVNYNKRTYPAQLIGTDPSSDLAVIKIDENSLPAISLGSSKNVQVGEWVVAVGNPFSLASTVTAGIVSAKGRRIGILEDKFPLESFIQTDAAINPGNSGGALVNKSGELIGINTAILSRTGSYTGYAFAVPVDIAKKVFDDLVKYGIVQKAVFGGSVVEYDYESAKKYDLNTDVKKFNGVLLERLDKEGPALKAGLKLGDIIVKVNDLDINTQSAFEEELSYHYPGDKISVTYIRNGKTSTTNVTLVNRIGTTEVIKRQIYSDSKIGAQFEANEYGVKVFQIKNNSVLKKIGVPENFTILYINRERVKDPKDVINFFDNFKGQGSLYGINSSRQQIEIPFVIR